MEKINIDDIFRAFSIDYPLSIPPPPSFYTEFNKRDMDICSLYSCTCPIAAHISLDANGETLVVKSVQSEHPI
jgi:hypothetical protein